MRGIVGFEIHISDIQTSWKLSQNRNDASCREVVHQLEASFNPLDNRVAEEMNKKRRLD
ncbi:MAG: hypothetical protein AAF655_00745 [Bacteroidota bacterium]